MTQDECEAQSAWADNRGIRSMEDWERVTKQEHAKGNLALDEAIQAAARLNAKMRTAIDTYERIKRDKTFDPDMNCLCRKCGGSGYDLPRYDEDGHSNENTTCDTCDGTGRKPK